MKPKIFIASSTASLEVAKSIQRELEHGFEVTLWSQSIFDISSTAIESLMKAAEDNPFGIFVFGADDKVSLASGVTSAVRDNVIFELGLFTGRRGRTNVFVVRPRGVDLHIPTDLAGITMADYDPSRVDGNLDAAVGSACTQIARQIKAAAIIEYPPRGHWGENVLSELTTTFVPAANYSLRAKLNNGQSLEVRLTCENTGPGNWYFSVARTGGWKVGKFDPMRQQSFHLLGPLDGDCEIGIQHGTKVKLEYFENGSSAPTKIRHLTHA